MVKEDNKNSMADDKKPAAAKGSKVPSFGSVYRHEAYILPLEERVKVAIRENDKIRFAADNLMKALSAARLDDEESCKMVLKIAKDRLIVDQWGRKGGHFYDSFDKQLEKPWIKQGQDFRRKEPRSKVAKRKIGG